jgi:hypothetical protein
MFNKIQNSNKGRLQMKIKTLSIKQPWAFLIVAGYKDIENRTWQTAYRGRFAIHASGKFDFDFFDVCNNWKACDAVCKHFGIAEGSRKITKNKHELGAILGTVELADIKESSDSEWYYSGNFAWILKNPEPLKNAITNVKGKLNLWTFDLP